MSDYKLVPVEPTAEMLEAYESASIAPVGPISKNGYKAMLAAAPAVQPHDVESVWMYKGGDSEWKPFTNEQHRLNTIADGGWDVREFFATPAVQGEPVGEVRLELGAQPYVFAELYSKSLSILVPGNKLYAAPQPSFQLPDFATDPDDSDEVESLWDHGFKRGWNACLKAATKTMQPAEQQPAPDVAKMQRKLEASFQREEQLEREVRDLKRERFKRFNEEECWMWAGDGSDRLETLTCPVVITPADLMAIINRGSPAANVAGLVEALSAISRNELDAQRAQHVAAVALANHRKGGGHV